MTTRDGTPRRQGGEEQRGQQERREIVEGEVPFDPVPVEPVLGGEAAGVVDEDVQRGVPRPELGDEPTDVRELREVGDEQLDGGIAGRRGDFVPRRLPLGPVAGDEDDGGATVGEFGGDRLAHAPGRAGDEADPAGHPRRGKPRGERRPGRGPGRRRRGR